MSGQNSINRKKLMILGGGIYQVPLIHKAREMGLETLVCSIPGKYPGIALADRFFPVDTRDKEAVCALAQREGAAGICTSGTDVAVISIGYTCDRLGLAGISLSAASRVTDKYLMKSAFAEGGVSTSPFRQVFSVADALRAAQELGYPVVIKPVDSSGSRGIRRVDTASQMPDAWNNAIRRTPRQYLIVESFVDADEIGVDGFVGEDASFEAFFPHTKFTLTTKEGTTLPAGHAFPWHADRALEEELHRQMSLAVKALGLRNCPFNADVFVRDGRVSIIEIGGRTGATCIPELIGENQGYNWYEKLIDKALGRETDFTGTRNRSCMARLIFTPVDALIERIDTAALRELEEKYHISIQMDYAPGTKIDAVHNATDRIGHVIAGISDPALLEYYTALATRCVETNKGNLQELCELYDLRVKE